MHAGLWVEASFDDAGDGCADPDGHMTLGQSIYWYLWNPERSGCAADLQQMNITISKLFVTPPPRYPEYDKLIEDGKVTAVVMFGQIGDELSEHDSGVRGFNRMASWLLEAEFKEVDDAPVGRRFSKHIGVVDYEIDLYSPYDFAGLSDMALYAVGGMGAGNLRAAPADQRLRNQQRGALALLARACQRGCNGLVVFPIDFLHVPPLRLEASAS